MAEPEPAPLSFAQRMAIRLLGPDRRAAIESSTREWIVTCPEGHRRDLWQLGGVRYKARGNKTTWGHCPECGRWRKLSVRRDPTPQPGEDQP